MKRVMVITFCLCLFPAVAAAESAQATCSASDEQCTEVPFDDADLVDGTIRRGGLDVMTAQGTRRHTSLINPRVHFIREIVRSAENL